MKSPVSRIAVIAVLSIGVASTAACNRGPAETAETTGSSMMSSDVVDATPMSDEAASTGMMSAGSTGADTRGTASGRTTSGSGSTAMSGETLTRNGSTATGDLDTAPPAVGTTRDTIEQTKTGLSPAGASSGPTAPTN